MPREIGEENFCTPKIEGDFMGRAPFRFDNSNYYRRDHIARLRESQIVNFGHPLNYTVSGIKWPKLP
jgi:hypothetical protein